ncbi:hypothetical protein ACFWGA_15780, partial [Amycolatopsis lurida]
MAGPASPYRNGPVTPWSACPRLKRLRASKMALVGAWIIAVFLLLAIIGPWVAPYAPGQQW